MNIKDLSGERTRRQQLVYRNRNVGRRFQHCQIEGCLRRKHRTAA